MKTWADRSHDSWIFWLNGMAGTGKSTIALTIARQYHKRKRLGASFFFSRGKSDVDRADFFFTTIAAQLVDATPSPISALGADSIQSPMVLVVDALVECENREDIRAILQLLAEAKRIKPARLRVFITSRPETPIELGFRRMSEIVHQDLLLHNVSGEIVDRGISILSRHKFGEIRSRWEDLRHTDWPGEQATRILIARAYGLFAHAYA
ncbi:hypothetical protein LTR28_009444 [Elasticomyces elasticus]|nr:hypothetical protein LTR28_009444 [Elasticomyces elasticus]